MSIQTLWAVPAQTLQQSQAFRDGVNAPGEAIFYLDAEARVWRTPVAGASPMYQNASREWLAFCESILTPKPAQPLAPPRHQWNTHFEWHSVPGPLRWLDRTQVDFFDENGWLVVEDAVAPATLERLIEEADAAERRGEEQLQRMRGGRGFIARANEITFTTHLVNRSAFVREFYKSKLFQDIGHDLIGPDVRLYWDQAVYKKPGVDKPFPWHQDNGYTFVEPQHYLTCWIGLDDATTENGCMWFVPGVHKLGTVTHELTDLGYTCYSTEPPNAMPVPTRAGTLIVLSSLTPHKTDRNLTDSVRRALVIQLVPDGAVAVTQDAWGKISRTVADRPDRQFKILESGHPCR